MMNLTDHLEHELISTLQAIKEQFEPQLKSTMLGVQIDLLIIKLRAGAPLPHSMKPTSRKHLADLLRREFDSKEWIYTDQIIETTEDAGFYELAEQMRKDLKNEGYVIHQ